MWQLYSATKCVLHIYKNHTNTIEYSTNTNKQSAFTMPHLCFTITLTATKLSKRLSFCMFCCDSILSSTKNIPRLRYACIFNTLSLSLIWLWWRQQHTVTVDPTWAAHKINCLSLCMDGVAGAKHQDTASLRQHRPVRNAVLGLQKFGHKAPKQWAFSLFNKTTQTKNRCCPELKRIPVKDMQQKAWQFESVYKYCISVCIKGQKC